MEHLESSSLIKVFLPSCLHAILSTSFEGGWDPSWDPVRKFFSLRPYKGHKRDRTREARYMIFLFSFHD